MKKLNMYYIISIITLAFMMFILMRTLEVTGWFDDPQVKSPAERILERYPGNYLLHQIDTDSSTQQVLVERDGGDGNSNQLLIRLDSIPGYMIKLSDFEDEQVLMELYQYDASGARQRLEGCEILLKEDGNEGYRGGTIGDFCGLKTSSSEYLALDLVLNDPTVSLEIQTHIMNQKNSLGSKKYLLERIASW